MTGTRTHGSAAVRADGGPRPARDAPGSDSLFKNAYFPDAQHGRVRRPRTGLLARGARCYSEDAVGRGSAAIAAMRLLAGITATTMIGAVVRFVPRAGRGTGRLVWGVYLASSVVVTLAAGVFLLTLDRWGPSYAPLGTPLTGALFVAACVAWALLTLQDGVLTGLRKAEWVPGRERGVLRRQAGPAGGLRERAARAGRLRVWAAAIAFSPCRCAGWSSAGSSRARPPPTTRWNRPACGPWAASWPATRSARCSASP
ncbi:hypothetical protein GCM10023238_21320 [Streptomyces heliomycini]